MANTKLVLDRQAKGKNFTFGDSGAGGEANVVFEKGTQAASQVVAEFKGSIKLNTLTGVPVFSSGTSQTTAADTDDIPEGSTNEYYTHTKVRTNKLNQMAAPDGDVSMNSQKITNLATPTSASDAATKGYVDGLVQGLDIHPSVRAATNIDTNLSSAPASIDGVTLSNGDRVLVKNQNTASQNGIYIFNGSGSAMTRASDADSSAEVTAGMFVFVEEGSNNADTGWSLTTDGAITLGTTNLTFTQFSGAGAITQGEGILINGTQINVMYDDVTIGLNGGDELEVKDGSITNAKLAGSIDASTKLTNQIPVANGGTGKSSVTSGRVLLGAGTSAMTELAGSSNGDVMTWNGSAWVASAPATSSAYQRATTVSGTQDSSNKTFTIGNAVSANSEQVFLNGQLLTPGSSNDYVLSGTTLTFQAAIDAPAATDVIRCYGTF